MPTVLAAVAAVWDGEPHVGEIAEGGAVVAGGRRRATYAAHQPHPRLIGAGKHETTWLGWVEWRRGALQSPERHVRGIGVGNVGCSQAARSSAWPVSVSLAGAGAEPEMAIRPASASREPAN